MQNLQPYHKIALHSTVRVRLVCVCAHACLCLCAHNRPNCVNCANGSGFSWCHSRITPPWCVFKIWILDDRVSDDGSSEDLDSTEPYYHHLTDSTEHSDSTESYHDWSSSTGSGMECAHYYSEDSSKDYLYSTQEWYAYSTQEPWWVDGSDGSTASWATFTTAAHHFRCWWPGWEYDDHRSGQDREG